MNVYREDSRGISLVNIFDSNLHVADRFDFRLTFVFVLEMFHQFFDIRGNFTEITIEILCRENVWIFRESDIRCLLFHKIRRILRSSPLLPDPWSRPALRVGRRDYF